MRSTHDFLENMSPSDWEFFAQDYLYELYGFVSLRSPSVGPDLGRDLVVLKDNKKYIVSCKHRVAENATIGLYDDFDFVDRIEAHSASGLICFYFAFLTTALQDKILKIKKEGRDIIVFDKNKILSDYQKLSYFTLEKYNYNPVCNVYPNLGYPLYSLNCLFCGKNIIYDKNIIHSSGGFLYEKDKKIFFVYGCKECFYNFCLSNYICNAFPYIEMWEAFFARKRIEFRGIIDEYVSDIDFEAAPDLERNWSTFISYASQYHIPDSCDPFLGLEL